MGTHPIFESDFDCLTVQTGFGGALFINAGSRQGLAATEW